MTRRQSRLFSLGVLTILATLVLAYCNASPEQATAYDLINESRRAHGLTVVQQHLTVQDKAQAWAEHLDATGELAHSTLADGLESITWVAAGEAVGQGELVGVHETFLVSPRHRDILLNPRWTHVGVGVMDDFVVYVFVEI